MIRRVCEAVGTDPDGHLGHVTFPIGGEDPDRVLTAIGREHEVVRL